MNALLGHRQVDRLVAPGFAVLLLRGVSATEGA